MPEERDALLTHYRQMRDALLAMIESLSDAQMIEPSLDGWSVKITSRTLRRGTKSVPARSYGSRQGIRPPGICPAATTSTAACFTICVATSPSRKCAGNSTPRGGVCSTRSPRRPHRASTHRATARRASAAPTRHNTRSGSSVGTGRRASRRADARVPTTARARARRGASRRSALRRSARPRSPGPPP